MKNRKKTIGALLFIFSMLIFFNITCGRSYNDSINIINLIEAPNSSSSPVPVITSSVLSPTNSPTFEITVDFDMVVTAGIVDDLIVTNGAFSVPSSGDNIVWYYPITPTTEGLVTIQYPADKYFDGEDGNLISNLFSITYDTTGPIPMISSLEPIQTNSPTFEITVDFDRVVTAGIADYLIVTNGAFSVPSSGDNIVWNYPITALAEGIVTFEYPADKYIDPAQNYNQKSNLFLIEYDSEESDPIMNGENSNISSFSVVGISIFALPILYILIKKSKKRMKTNNNLTH